MSINDELRAAENAAAIKREMRGRLVHTSEPTYRYLSTLPTRCTPDCSWYGCGKTCSICKPIPSTGTPT